MSKVKFLFFYPSPKNCKKSKFTKEAFEDELKIPHVSPEVLTKITSKNDPKYNHQLSCIQNITTNCLVKTENI